MHSRSGNIHRKQRKMLTPVFSAKHMRGLMPVFYRVTDKVGTTRNIAGSPVFTIL